MRKTGWLKPWLSRRGSETGNELMKKMLETKFGCLVYILGFNLFVAYVWAMRSVYKLSLFEGLILIIAAQLLPYGFLVLIDRWLVIPDVRWKAIIWFVVYILFWAGLWYVVQWNFSSWLSGWLSA